MWERKDGDGSDTQAMRRELIKFVQNERRSGMSFNLQLLDGRTVPLIPKAYGKGVKLDITCIVDMQRELSHT